MGYGKKATGFKKTFLLVDCFPIGIHDFPFLKQRVHFYKSSRFLRERPGCGGYISNFKNLNSLLKLLLRKRKIINMIF